MNSRSAKSIVSVFAAPVMAGLLMGPVLAVTSLLGGPGTETMVVQLVLIAACLIGIPGTLIIGLPVHALLLAMRWTRWWNYIIAGGACGILFASADHWIWAELSSGISCFDELNRANSLICQDRMSIIMSHVQRTGLWVVAGTITAACCWLIRRPDRDRARTELTFSE